MSGAQPTKIRHYTTIGSTNDEALRILREEAPPLPLYVTADTQTAGRGRQDRTWVSPVGNIYATVALDAGDIKPDNIALFTLYAALRVCDKVRGYINKEMINNKIEKEIPESLPLWLKWPNDLWIGKDVKNSKKCAGFLAEVSEVRDKSGKTSRVLIVGMGLNVNVTNYPDGMLRPPTSLKTETGRDWDIAELRQIVLGSLVSAFESFASGEYKNDLPSLWHQYDRLTQQTISYEQNQGGQKQTRTGSVLGLSDNGALRVQLPEGSIINLRSGEVSLSQKFIV